MNRLDYSANACHAASMLLAYHRTVVEEALTLKELCGCPRWRSLACRNCAPITPYSVSQTEKVDVGCSTLKCHGSPTGDSSDIDRQEQPNMVAQSASTMQTVTRRP